MELFCCLATHSFALVWVATTLTILEDVFSREIEEANYLYWLSELTDVYGILCKSYTMLFRLSPDT